MISKAKCYKLAAVRRRKIETVRLRFCSKLFSLQFYNSAHYFAHGIPHVEHGVLFFPARFALSARQIRDIKRSEVLRVR